MGKVRTPILFGFLFFFSSSIFFFFFLNCGRIGQGRGWRSLLVRLYDIEYETAEDRKQAPKTMIMKFPLGNRREVQCFIHLL